MGRKGATVKRLVDGRFRFIRRQEVMLMHARRDFLDEEMCQYAEEYVMRETKRVLLRIFQ